MEVPGRILRRMGYRRDQEGIMNRFLAEKGSWNAHLEKTRNFIIDSLPGDDTGTVAILGSGWLLDIPLEALASRYKHVILADIIHPPQVQRRVRDMKNVELLECDLTGGAIALVWHHVRGKREKGTPAFPEHPGLVHPLEDRDYNAVASVNLLNQLDILLVDYMAERGCRDEEAAERFRTELQSFHLDWITRTPGCLISDVSEISRDRSGKETSRRLLYCELPSGIRSDRWDWDFDTRRTYRPGATTRMEVRAVEWA
jgi:hypothetical protein